MARDITVPTNAVPHLAIFTAANNDINSTTAGTAPLRVPENMLDADAIVIYPAVDGGTPLATPEWHLIFVDADLAPVGDGERPLVITVLYGVSGGAPTERTDDPDGDGDSTLDISIQVPIQFDIRGIRGRGTRRTKAYLAVANIGGAADAFLMGWGVVEKLSG